MFDRRSVVQTAVADLYGRPHDVYLSGRGVASRVAFDEDLSDSEEQADALSHTERVARILAAVIDTFNEWTASGHFTLVQLRTIRMLLLEGRSLRDVARREGVSAAAISARIIGLHDKAPQFMTWWSLRHARRRLAALIRHAHRTSLRPSPQ